MSFLNGLHLKSNSLAILGILAMLGLGWLAQKASAQSITISAPFDPSLPIGTDDDGQSLGMQTFFDAVSADGKTIVGHAWEFDKILTIPDENGDDYDIVEYKIVTFKWRDGVFTKLPFFHPDSPNANANLLGISADGSRIYGVTDKDALHQPNPPIGVYESGAVTPASFGPWVDFAPGLQGRTKPTGGWVGKAANTNDSVNAVSDDFTLFVGSSGTSVKIAKVWTVDGVTSIPPTDGFTESEATGVSADGRVVCGNFTGHPNWASTGDAGFVWTKNSGTILLRSMVRDQGFPFNDNFPNINALAISGDGGTVVGRTDGVDPTGRDYGFRLLLGPSVTIRLPGGTYSVDEPFKAEVTVFSPTEQPQTISFPAAVLTSPDGKCEFEFEEGEDPVESFKLSQALPSRTFNVMVTPKDSGTLELATEVEAVSTKGTLTLTDSAEFYITPLKVTVVMKPLVAGKPVLNVELDDKGNVTDSEGHPVTPKVEVTIENLSSTPLVGALQGVDPRARDRSTALGRIRTVAEFPMDFPAIVKGVPIKREIDLELNEDGRFEFVASVTAREQNGTHGFTAVGRGAPLAVGEPYPLRLEIKMVRTPAVTNQNNGAIFVKPGSKIQFLATVENLTTNSTIKFHGVRAKKHLNVQGAVLTNDGGNLVDPPFSPDCEVDSGSSEILSGYVNTDTDGGPSGTLTWQGLEDIVQVDDATNEETELDMDDVLVESTVTGWLGDDLSLRVIQDNSISFPPPTLDNWEITACWSNGALIAAGKWTYDNLDAVGGLGRFAGNIAGNPSALADAWGEGSRAVWEMAENSARTWQGMSEADREEFIMSYVAEVQRRAYLMATTRSPFDPEDFNAALNYTRGATYVFFGGMESAYASNDPARIANVWGSVSSNIALEVATSLLPSPKFQEYSKAAEAVRLATNLDAARLITKQDDLLRTVKTGLVNAETVRNGWGIGGLNLQDIQTLFSKFKVKGYLRERSPRAFELIDTLKQAVWKPEKMKPKGFSEIDALIVEDLNVLPYAIGDGGQNLGLDGVTVIFLPEADDIIANRARTRLIAKGDYPLEDIEEAVQACLKRAQQRREEFAEYLPEFQKWKSDTVVNNGGIPVSRNYKDNGVPNPDGFENAKRGFTYEQHAMPNGQPMYIPKMKDTSGVFRYISGDIDWIHFTFLDGTALDSKTARRLYDAMFRCCGLQHPETISWILKGETVFKGKLNQIGEYLTGQKALLEVTGESTRAVHINQKLTRFAKDGRRHLIFFDGGIKARTRAVLADASSALAWAQNRFPDRRVLMPFLQIPKFNDALNRAGAADGAWTYSATENDSVLLRENSEGEYQIYNGTSWEPWNRVAPAPRRNRNAPTVHLVPTSNLTETAVAGATEIQIADLPAQWPDELAGHVASWFAAGQTIVIDPGELTQEVRTLAATGPLSFTEPLQYAHPKNALVAVVPIGMSIGEISTNASALLSTDIDLLRGTVTMVWQSIPGRQYVLETATAANPNAWTALLTDLAATEGVLTLEIPYADYDATASYRLRNIGTITPLTDFKIISFTTNKAASTATLVWSSVPGREYAVETSADLAAHSWKMEQPTINATGQTASITLSLNPAAPRMFYRLRDLTAAPLGAGMRIVSFAVNPVASTISLAWTSEPGRTYHLEFCDDLTSGIWRTVEPPVSASGIVTTRTMPYDPSVKRRFYRVHRDF